MLNLELIETNDSFIVSDWLHNGVYELIYDSICHCSLKLEISGSSVSPLFPFNCDLKITIPSVLPIHDKYLSVGYYFNSKYFNVYDNAKIELNMKIPAYVCILPDSRLTNCKEISKINFYNIFSQKGSSLYIKKHKQNNITLEFDILLLCADKDLIKIRTPIFCESPLGFYQKYFKRYIEFDNNEKYFYNGKENTIRDNAGVMFYDSKIRISSYFKDDFLYAK